MGVFVIAEAGSSHDNDLSKAYRLIEAAKECGADAVKFQWTTNAEAMAIRRGTGSSGFAMYKHYLEKPIRWIHELKAHADVVGIEFMCTVYLIEDIQFVRHTVKRFKISAFEATWADFVYAHKDFGKPVIISKNRGKQLPDNTYWTDVLHCVSEYPTPLERLGLRNGMQESNCVDGLSDHTTSMLTGALAVAAGATIVEKHIRLRETSKDNPDYPHSLEALPLGGVCDFAEYVYNIREAEKAL